jgi:predicted dienelactone hydrolase
MNHVREATLTAAVLISLLTGCGDSAPNGLSFSVEEDGPYAIGYREIEVTYASPASDPARTITVAIWYPVEKDVVPTLVAPEYAFYTIFPSGRAIVDAPLAEAAYEAGYPLLVHSHGHAGFPQNSYHLAEGFASHGWIVAAPAHVGNTIDIANGPVPVTNLYERPLDISATIDAIAALPVGDPLSGRVVTDRVVLSGHSRGTFTVWAALGADFDEAHIRSVCESGAFDETGGCTEAQLSVFERSFEDDRIVAGMPLAGNGDGGWFGNAAGMNGVTVPMLMMTGSDDPVGADTLFATVTEPDITWVDIEGGCHQLYGFGGCSLITDTIGQPLVNAYALAFARRELFDDDDRTVLGLLDGSVVLSDLVTLVTR